VNPSPPEAQELPGNSSIGGLTIGALAERTGVAVATLRMWEARHGFPRATRLPSGHRRYDEQTVDQVLQVQRRKDSGLRLETAVAEVTAGPVTPASSVFAELRRRHPGLMPHRLRKTTLLALTWALEDECCARAQQPWLFGAFQKGSYYRRAEQRWRDLAGMARTAWALADFDDAQAQEADGTGPVEVALPLGSPMRREWSLVCVAPDFPAALAAWELPGQQRVPDGERLFESLWTLEPAAVRDAARCCAELVTGLGHDTTALTEELDRPLPVGSSDLRHATQLFNRVTAYVDRVR
jgi:DICT domain-containing protein